jgi:hypothetical protein
VFEGKVRAFQLRLPEAVARRLERSAAANRRSMNSEALVAVEAWLGKADKRKAVGHE